MESRRLYRAELYRMNKEWVWSQVERTRAERGRGVRRANSSGIKGWPDRSKKEVYMT